MPTKKGHAPMPPSSFMETTDETMPMMGGKFSEMGKKDEIKYNKATGSVQHWMQFVVDIFANLFTLVIAIGAIWQMTDITAPTFPYATWQDVIIVRAGLTFALTMWWTVSEVFNSKARARKASELPCPERISSLAWYWVILIGWFVAIGFYASFYADHTANDTRTQDSSFQIKLVIILFVAAFDISDYARWLCRIPLDYILIRSGSHCLGC